MVATSSLNRRGSAGRVSTPVRRRAARARRVSLSETLEEMTMRCAWWSMTLQRPHVSSSCAWYGGLCVRSTVGGSSTPSIRTPWRSCVAFRYPPGPRNASMLRAAHHVAAASSRRSAGCSSGSRAKKPNEPMRTRWCSSKRWLTAAGIRPTTRVPRRARKCTTSAQRWYGCAGVDNPLMPSSRLPRRSASSGGVHHGSPRYKRHGRATNSLIRGSPRPNRSMRTGSVRTR